MEAIIFEKSNQEHVYSIPSLMDSDEKCMGNIIGPINKALIEIEQDFKNEKDMKNRAHLKVLINNLVSTKWLIIQYYSKKI